MNENPGKWSELYWPNTVHLSLFIEKTNDLFSLHPHALPILDHLYVTILKSGKCFMNNIESNLQEKGPMNTTHRLRSLQLHHISLGDLLIFVSTVNMPLLEKLTLIEVYDNSKSNDLIFSI